VPISRAQAEQRMFAKLAGPRELAVASPAQPNARRAGR